jgi:hypothetical protein
MSAIFGQPPISGALHVLCSDVWGMRACRGCGRGCLLRKGAGLMLTPDGDRRDVDFPQHATQCISLKSDKERLSATAPIAAAMERSNGDPVEARNASSPSIADHESDLGSRPSVSSISSSDTDTSPRDDRSSLGPFFQSAFG